MSKRKLESLEAKAKADWENHRGLGEVLDSTKTNSEGWYGDFGRYELESAVHDFQRQRLRRPRLEGSSYQTNFDARISRRYVVQRALELGLDPSQPDHSSITSSNTRDRPAIERLGKKYQWIAFYEFLGYLSDHFHLEKEWENQDGVFRSARDLNPPHLLDPFRPDPVRDDEDEFGWDFVPPPTPWWQLYENPFPRPMTTSQREAFLLKDVVSEPTSLLRVCDPNNQEWIALDGRVEFYEPVASFARKGADDCEQASLYWSFNSYAIPKALVPAMAGTMSSPRFEDHSMCPDSPSYHAQLRDLQTYPNDLNDLAAECAKVW
ncbi:MAG: hypothetical protein IAG10_26245 [Planctomycetaceae bacterium]|nr:hypothetical protein [Planctomycetaceae bacterium]